jgi:alkyl sulfatase BDS1-like metallo-beta-lactamase superfamily hydrolase
MAMQLTLDLFLKELIALMKQDYPLQLQKMITSTEGLTWLQTLDNENTIIRVTDDDVVIGEKVKPKKIDVRISLSRKSLFDLLEGRITLDKALQTKKVEAFGEPATLLKCYRIFEQILLLSRLSPRFYFLTYRLR